jgi:membrane-associated phospholipid phosphatase
MVGMKLTLVLIVLLFYEGASGQTTSIDPVASVDSSNKKNDSLIIPSHNHVVRKAVVVPLILVGAGLCTIPNREVFFSRYEIREERNAHIPHFRYHADNYLQFVPIAAVYGLNAFGVKAKNDFGNRTALLIKSELIMATLTLSLKRITAVPRPDTGAPTSFPSGHTAQAFAAATFMIKEYGQKNIWYSVGAYTVASGVGILRVMNNRHWVSDVLAGAGIGIFSTNIAYLTHRYKWGKQRNKSSSTLVLPAYSNRAGMLCMVHRF